MKLTMKFYVMLCLLLCALLSTSYGQDLSSDSLKAINDEALELNKEVARLKAKQDSLARERYKIESEQRAEQRALQLQQQQVQQQNVPSGIAPQREKSVNDGRNIIGLSAFQFLISGIDISYERAISEHTSLILSAAYHSMSDYDENSNSSSSSTYPSSSNSHGGPGNLFLVNGNVAYQGAKVQLQFRGYLFDELPVLRGLYVGPYVFYKQDMATEEESIASPSLPPFYNTTYTYTYTQYFAQAMGAGIDVGYQFAFLKYLTLNPFVGVGMIIPLTDSKTAQHVNIDVLNPYKGVVSVRTGFVLGFLF